MATVAIAPDTGPEIVFGSTRMKSGTAQKMVLNTLSTAAMVRLGRVYGDLMVEMPATNAKLRRRAARMVELAAEASPEETRAALEATDGSVKAAIVMLRAGCDAAAATARLRRRAAACGGRSAKGGAR